MKDLYIIELGKWRFISELIQQTDKLGYFRIEKTYEFIKEKRHYGNTPIPTFSTRGRLVGVGVSFSDMNPDGRIGELVPYEIERAIKYEVTDKPTPFEIYKKKQVRNMWIIFSVIMLLSLLSLLCLLCFL